MKNICWSCLSCFFFGKTSCNQGAATHRAYLLCVLSSFISSYLYISRTAGQPSLTKYTPSRKTKGGFHTYLKLERTASRGAVVGTLYNNNAAVIWRHSFLTHPAVFSDRSVFCFSTLISPSTRSIRHLVLIIRLRGAVFFAWHKQVAVIKQRTTWSECVCLH